MTRLSFEAMELRALCAADLSSASTVQFVDQVYPTDTAVVRIDYACTESSGTEGDSYNAELPRRETAYNVEFVDLGTLVGIPCQSESNNGYAHSAESVGAHSETPNEIGGSNSIRMNREGSSVGTIDSLAHDNGSAAMPDSVEFSTAASVSEPSGRYPAADAQVGASNLSTPDNTVGVLNNASNGVSDLSTHTTPGTASGTSTPLSTANSASRIATSGITAGGKAASSVERLRVPSVTFVDVGIVVDTSPTQRKLQPGLTQSSTTGRLNSTSFVASQDVLSHFSGGDESTSAVRRQREIDPSLPTRRSIIARRRSAMTPTRESSDSPPSQNNTSAWTSHVRDDATRESLTTPGRTTPQANANDGLGHSKPHEPNDKLPPLGIEANMNLLRLQHDNRLAGQPAVLEPLNEPTVLGLVALPEVVLVMPQEEDEIVQAGDSQSTGHVSLSYSIVIGCATPILADQFNKKTRPNQRRNVLLGTVETPSEPDIVD